LIAAKQVDRTGLLAEAWDKRADAGKVICAGGLGDEVGDGKAWGKTLG
jgi:hypothetical protein